MERAGALTECLTTSSRLQGLSGLARRPREPSQCWAVDRWTVRVAARSGSPAVDNVLRCPLHEPLPSCPWPSITTIKEDPISKAKTTKSRIQGLCDACPDARVCELAMRHAGRRRTSLEGGNRG